MTKKKYSDAKEIRDKIQLLFSYRKLTSLLQLSKLDQDKEFKNQLVDIQYQIYLLDAYLEGEWLLDKNKLKSCWSSISSSLAKLNYNDHQIDGLLSEIRNYERIERNCRKGKWPTAVSFKNFYTTKSCDVRLVRHLIYDAQPELNSIWKETAWVYYDLITEINDDVGDVAEDLNTYNGNRYLISILRKGKIKTEKQYKTFLEKVTNKAKVYFKKHLATGENAQLFEWTMSRSKETLELLDTSNRLGDPSNYSKSLLLEKMK